tara:strand:- start:116 stop:502 length:387 start_codon:yes stop_codon:yes gene_type:complete
MLVGDKYQHQFSFSQQDVNLFAQVTGDNNPIHLDEEKAAKSIFKRRIIHGFLGGSVFSKVFGTLWPGYGTIYMEQDLQFKRPMAVDHNYTAAFEVLEVLPKNKAIIRTQVLDENQKLVIDGNAEIIYP